MIQQQEEQMRIQQQQEEQMRIQQQQEEQMRIQRQQEEQMRIQQQQEEQRRIQMQQEEEARAAAEMRRQQEEAERQRQEQMQRQQQEEQMRIQQQQEAAERQRQEQIERQEMERQQQLMMQQQSMSQISLSSTTTKSGAIDEDLEEQKRREYEEWFKSQEREALEYSACVNYQEKASEVQNVGKTTTITEITEQQTFSQQQQSSHQTVHNSSMSGTTRGSDTAGTRSRSEGLFGQTAEPGETDKILNKWDNHNAIARGWGGVKENYHRVTFRGIYNVDSQTQNL